MCIRDRRRMLWESASLTSVLRCYAAEDGDAQRGRVPGCEGGLLRPLELVMLVPPGVRWRPTL
eukprot:3748611-Alexandrium_andersonii.AAC.1